ncbi:hypothetical protein [Pontibacter sp. H249]|uniref:hypothetical protein n=1 Tax=Pontibacter sp. H249 TaxID=3133420 RepID=UPI0030C16E04
MYDKEAVRKRFLEEVERLVSTGVARSYAQVAEGCGLKSYHLSDVRNSRTDVSLQVLASFVQAYRPHGVSYGYILDGEREQPVIPQAAIQQVEKARQELDAALKTLTNP